MSAPQRATTLAMVGEWPEAEAELLVRDVPLLRLRDVTELEPHLGGRLLAVIDVDRQQRLDDALALLERCAQVPSEPRPQLAFLASEETSMLSKVARAFALGLTALFVKPAPVAALLRKLDMLGVVLPAGPSATLRPPEPPPLSPRKMSLPPLGIRDRQQEVPSSVRRPSSVPPPRPSRLLTDPSPAVDSVLPSTAGGRVRPSTPNVDLSPELLDLLYDAEQRAEWHDEEFALPSPEDEVEAVLPKAVLDALDEPLDRFEDDVPQHLNDPPPFAPHDTHDGTTGVGETEHGTRREQRKKAKPPTAERELTGAGDGREATTNHRRIATRPPPADERTGQDDAATGAGVRGDVLDGDEPTGHGKARRSVAPPPAAAQPLADDDDEIADAALTPRPPSLAPATPLRSANRVLQPQPSPLPPRRSSPRPAPPASRRFETALGAPGDALAAMAQAAASGFDGIMELRAEEGVRVVRFMRGDVALAVSHVAGEGLADFLAVRGEMSKEKAARLARRMPTFGRFAAAALVASGVLAKDDMWSVLRAHSEFVLDNIARLEDGTRIETTELGRLADEPPVFGASTGAEVITDTVRRTVAEAEARSRIGGLRSRLAFGPNKQLLAECGLEPGLRARLEAGEGERLEAIEASLVRGQVADFATVLYALSLLGVVDLVRELAPASEPPPPAGADVYDDEALRAAILARSALVDEGDYFALLGVSRNATGYEIRRAFLDLRRKFELARALTPRTLDLKDDLVRILDVLEEAYEILADQARRERYLRALSLTPS